MRAALCRSLGPPSVVEIDDVPSPPLGAGEVRIRVAAAAVNYPDVLLVAGTYQLRVEPPFVPGSELAGVVVDVGEGVSGVAVGDVVCGTTLVGAFAEEAVVAVGAVRAVPAGMDVRVAAASGVAHRTAYHVLRSVARVQPGEHVVVLGAGGGVGLAAVQLAVELGATVTAVASSPDKRAAASRYGAIHVVDVRAGDLREALRAVLPDGADVVVDPVGGDVAEPALRSLRWGGRFVTVGYASGTIPRIPLNLVLLKGVHVLGFQFVDFATRAPAEFERNERELDALLANGRAVPHIGATFPLERTADALQLVATGRAIGKVVIDVQEIVRPPPV